MVRIQFLIYFQLMLLFLQPIFAADDQGKKSDDIDALVANIIQAGGGEKHIEALTSLSAEGNIAAIVRQDRGRYSLTFERPRKLRVETLYTQSTETRILNGTKGYRGVNGLRPEEVNDFRLTAMVYQYKHQDLLFGLLHHHFKITRTGTETLNGNPVEVLRLIDDEGPPIDVCVDAKTFRVVKVTGHFVVAGGQQTTLSSDFFDFREIDGYLMPFKIVFYGGPMKIAETEIKTWLINPKVEASMFVP